MTTTRELEDGFYWVRFNGTAYWEVSLHISGRFFMAGYVGTDGSSETFDIPGNVYLMNSNGKTISTYAPLPRIGASVGGGIG